MSDPIRIADYIAQWNEMSPRQMDVEVFLVQHPDAKILWSQNQMVHLVTERDWTGEWENEPLYLNDHSIYERVPYYTTDWSKAGKLFEELNPGWTLGQRQNQEWLVYDVNEPLVIVEIQPGIYGSPSINKTQPTAPRAIALAYVLKKKLDNNEIVA